MQKSNRVIDRVSPAKNAAKELERIIADWADRNIETIAPAIVTAVSEYEGAVVVTVSPVILEDQGDNQLIEHPLIYNCPVLNTGSQKGYLSIPPQVGDTVAIGYCKRSIEEFTYVPIDGTYLPVDDRLFGCSDAVVLGYWNQQQKDIKPSSTDLQLRYYNSLISITPEDNIKIENTKGTWELQSSGKVTWYNDNGSAELGADGSHTLTNSGGGQIQMASGGVVTINGVTFSLTGDVSTSGSITGGSVSTTAGSDLDTTTDAYNAHGSGAANHPPDDA